MPSKLFRLGTLLTAMFCASVMAAQPPIDEAAKAKAAEAAARKAWAAKVDAYQLCKSQDAVAARYFADMARAGKQVPPPVATAECADPGPFAAETPPLEAAGAHSPPADAAQPPSSQVPEAKLENGAKK
ncbi:MAG: hypothetical protein GX576_10640 [Thauera phenolivorans]|uniref:Uncharacterized protein n=1 Tax=Thauera phenolivorans TaxID=1792543 RepID=A0A7X7LX20_9RHOO|nr:hypothetical protein [Thauera phenolivorans]NLF54828.1 hypothetical protein [Thauera phenolivorans]